MVLLFLGAVVHAPLFLGPPLRHGLARGRKRLLERKAPWHTHFCIFALLMIKMANMPFDGMDLMTAFQWW